ncbi:response regulator [Oscillatoria sp. FACHB-1406]|uniref:ATP-binding response regulator n=1 Tax=Oscillatoria sp. FACHB-1406 TaxID=2692846 RepID=UPI001689139D|nr:response regulator [Oscillatoria sp. FACHB-1406]MBD2578587.1 response regulator [Oscillatoria sp. FACHB-1406]
MTTILVIEDEISLRNNILALLKAEGFKCLGADTGERGIVLATQENPSLIICDIMMPGINGYTVLERLQGNERTALIPFIFLTAKSDRSDIRQGFLLGADDYLTKPFDSDELLGAISVRLKKQEQLYQRFQELSAELERLSTVIAAKDDALENFSQEMRRPLTNLKLAVDRLQQSNDPEQREVYLEILRAEFQREIQLLDQVSALQKLLTPENITLLNQFNMLKPN